MMRRCAWSSANWTWKSSAGTKQETPGREVAPMSQQILLLGVDMDLSPATSAMLQMARSFLVQLAPQCQALLLTVIPVPYDTPRRRGRIIGQARCTLQRAWAVLVQGGVAPGRLEMQVREGVPAEELVKVAAEWQIACIVLGYRGAALRHRLRRLLLGSTTAQVLRRAPCLVLLVPMPSSSTHLVTWYEAAITRELSEHTSGLFMFT